MTRKAHIHRSSLRSFFSYFVQGKTTLLNELWNLKEATGNLDHTEEQKVHEVHGNLIAIDFPGYNGYEDHHAEAFKSFSAMNNLLILVIKFDGDVNQDTMKMVAETIKATAIARSSEVIICMNKCGYGEFADTVS